MKKFAIIGLMIFGTFGVANAADETCYQVSTNGVAWSKTPEVLCVKEVDRNANQFEITLKSGITFNQQTLATFNYSLLAAAVRCMDCNKDGYGVASPSDSTFNVLGIKFDGTRDLQTGKESGTVEIGETKLHYYKN